MSAQQDQHPKQQPASGRLFLSKLAALPDDDAAEAAGHSKRLQPGQQHGPVEPVSGAEETLWKEFSASFRRKNNKIG
ncbi:hypothetical protein OEZ85_003071 [Tetradesmus obliquus]|uniref:Uncharacterized protein n=1 Tax=Tetradesmus obliquus TaxID=3088 RepID=A0ABY8U0C5_TETOB|nr:hypothetical protein OEZ85_003071 [Tetradesmus obliquus]